MGMSADAHLAYGYIADEKFTSPLIEDDFLEEWDDYIAAQRGLIDPWIATRELARPVRPFEPVTTEHAEWKPDQKIGTYVQQGYWLPLRPQLTAWHDALKAIRLEYGVDYMHAGYEFAVECLVIPDSKSVTYGAELLGALPQRQLEWDSTLELFLTDFQVDRTNLKGPGWILAASYG